jgi:signal transduction histidine kinase
LYIWYILAGIYCLMRRIFITIMSIIFFAAFAECQQLTPIDINKIETVDSIGIKTVTAFGEKSFSSGTELSSLSFNMVKKKLVDIKPPVVSKKIFSKFIIYNSAAVEKGIYFYPGLFFEGIQLYKIKNNIPEPVASKMPFIKDSIGYRYISLPPGDTATIIAEMTSIKTYNSKLTPRLIKDNYMLAYSALIHARQKDMDMLTYTICGLMLMMIFFSLANYVQGGNREFLYYAGYAFFTGLMLFLSRSNTFYATKANFFIESYLDFALHLTGYCFYMVFMQKYLATKENYSFLHKLFKYATYFLVAVLVLYSFVHFFTGFYHTEYLIEVISKSILIAIIPAFLWYSRTKWENKLLRYMFWGNLSLLIFALLSQTTLLIRGLFGTQGIFSHSLTYYEIGLLLELIFFLAGLTYKNRRLIIDQTKDRERLRTENDRKEIEKQLAILKAQQEERNRISADMHDELGSGMTAIRLMSEIAKNKMKENTPKEIDRISASANDVLNKMNAIIWSMNSGNDSAGNLVAYIRSYTLEYLDNTPVNCKINTPEEIPEIEMTGDKRRNIFLCVKESLNNILKHSQATEVKIDITVNDKLEITIADNGVGIDKEKIRQFGNGLKNIAHRMEMIGGTYAIVSNGGAITTLSLPLH